MSAVIKEINVSSPAYIKVKVGERLKSINGNEIHDVLDYKYFAYDSALLIALETPDGRDKIVYIKKAPGEDLGLEFETYLMDGARSCANRCVFCFVDQLPKGMRETLYFKDDDARLSFLTGNYITMTNLSDREIQRIVDLKVSPINISVHASDRQIRRELLGHQGAGRSIEIMEKFARGGIVMNCQIVCCPGLNDGQVLLNTMQALSEMYPNVRSVSIVPVGLTKHREGLYPLRPFDSDGALLVIRAVEAFARQCLETKGSRIFFCSDEMYLRAQMPLPEDCCYEGYPQLENGVGMLRLTMTEFLEALEDCPNRAQASPFAIATGVSAGPFMGKLLETLAGKCDNINGRVYVIENDFFGHTIDVAGLITGCDLINQLKGKDLGQRLLISQNMLRSGEDVFLDDVTLEDVEAALGVTVVPVAQDGAELMRAMVGEDKRRCGRG